MANDQDSELFYPSLFQFLLHTKHYIMSLTPDTGLSSMQVMTLLLTDPVAGNSMHYFRKVYACDPSNITGIIDGLEHKGLVARQEHPHDRRVKMIMLLPSGSALRAQLIDKIVASEDTVLGGLDENERQTFIGLIMKIGKSYSQSDQD